MSNGKKKNPSITSADSGRWLNIVPGIVIALVVSAFVGSQWTRASIELRQHSNLPIMNRRIAPSSLDKERASTPEVSFIVKHASKLHVTQSQRAHLLALQSKSTEFYGPRTASTRRGYWNRAISILNPDQRRILQAEREADCSTGTERLSTRTGAGS